jgi:hypothetical protein
MLTEYDLELIRQVVEYQVKKIGKPDVGLLREAYDEGRRYPHDKAGSSFERWLSYVEKRGGE